VASLWWILAVLAAARAALAFVPSMWAWSLNLQRFLPLLAGWVPWGLAALALIPALGRGAAPAADAVGEAIARRPAWSLPAAAAGAALVVWSLPDRAWFVGDFLLRQYTLEGRPTAIATWYPYALPLDLLLHDSVARVLMSRFGFHAGDTGRLLGAVEAALLGMLAVAFARVLRLRGLAALAASGVVFWGGHLTMLTGYNKAFSELPLVVAAVAVGGVQVAREGRMPLTFAAALALGFVLHRSALGLVPVAAVVWLQWSRAQPGAWRRPASLAALALPVAALAAMLPRIVTIVTRIDPMHFAPEEVRRAGGVIPGLFLGTRLVDLANVVVLLSPLALAAPLVAAWAGRTLPWRSEGLVLVTLALPFLGCMPFIHPGQGYYRDWDDFAAAGMALSLVTAWLVARTVEQSPRHAWVAVAAVLAVAGPALQWLIHQNDVDRGLARVEKFLRERPSRTESERARAWDYLGWRTTDLGRFDQAAAAFAQLAALQPSPRVMRQWAAVEVLRGDPGRAQQIYRRMLDRFPDVSAGWFELARLSYQVGDLDESRRAAGEMLRLRPGDPGARRLIAHLDSLRGARAR
jgi:tetratricopeptide repeat protein